MQALGETPNRFAAALRADLNGVRQRADAYRLAFVTGGGIGAVPNRANEIFSTDATYEFIKVTVRLLSFLRILNQAQDGLRFNLGATGYDYNDIVLRTTTAADCEAFKKDVLQANGNHLYEQYGSAVGDNLWFFILYQSTHTALFCGISTLVQINIKLHTNYATLPSRAHDISRNLDYDANRLFVSFNDAIIDIVNTMAYQVVENELEAQRRRELAFGMVSHKRLGARNPRLLDVSEDLIRLMVGPRPRHVVDLWLEDVL